MAGLPPLSHGEVMSVGSYNAFLQTTLPPEHRIYDPDTESFESSMETFLTAFPRGFAIEVLDVDSGPPKITFKFRHWGYMEGPFKGHPPHGQRIEFFGVCIFHVDEEIKVEKIDGVFVAWGLNFRGV
ncbi:hypothetical protein EJB05_31878, partial [Eragrostis curvula]